MAVQAEFRVLHDLPYPLDHGVYLQSEAALLTGLPKTTVRRWLQLGRADTGTVAKQPRVSFPDLISLRAVAALRAAGLRLARIRAGADHMRCQLGIEHPLAAEKLRTDGVHLYFEDTAGLVAVSAGGQLAAQQLVDAYLRDVKYGASRGKYRVATSWEPPGVVIDPTIQRGAPCVAGSRVQIAMLQRYADASDPPELLAQLFELNPGTVATALDWYGSLKQAA